jgi:hypothetical protein
VKKDDIEIPIEFYSKFCNEKIINEVSKHLVIWKTSNNILKNKTHFNKIVLLNKE